MSHTHPDPWAETPGPGLHPDREPTEAELAAIEREMPVIRAEVELLDVRIALLDRQVYPIDAKRFRRAQRRLMVARARVSNRAQCPALVGGAL
ncbi:DUF6284 family protein [Streptomyces sp. B1866]|uniref:DUF6284 family protein n=1 Tax=Streptomyces sp. B1866 TaxID=3075431 RepID=UPI0028922C39|nr:DUF6284 family protein [Streptomyces sp. B1866]MDT3395760.1 DUF6284 family protein [Streptomyces sp. B1866]